MVKQYRMGNGGEAGMKKNRKFLAALLIVLMVFANIGSEVGTAFSKTGKTAVFEMDRENFAMAVKEAAADRVEMGDVDFEITDGSAEQFWALFAEDGGMYEVTPEIQGGASGVEMRVFVRLPETDDEEYNFTGQEEVYFLFTNHGEETVKCVLRIAGKTGENIYTVEMAPLELPGYTAAFGDSGEATPSNMGNIPVPAASKASSSNASEASSSNASKASPSNASEASPSDAEKNPATASNADLERLEWEVSDLIGIEESSTARLCMTELDKLAAIEPEETVYEYETDEFLVRAMFSGAVSIPEDAQLSLKMITEESDPERYAARCAQFIETWGGDGTALELYDIGFYTGDGDHIDVSEQAIVSLQFKSAPLQMEGGLAVIHFTEGEPELLKITELETDDENQVRALAFDTAGFSDFAISRNGVSPQTGGTGTAPYTITGILLMACVVLLYELRYKRTAAGGSLYKYKVNREGGEHAP